MEGPAISRQVPYQNLHTFPEFHLKAAISYADGEHETTYPKPHRANQHHRSSEKNDTDFTVIPLESQPFCVSYLKANNCAALRKSQAQSVQPKSPEY